MIRHRSLKLLTLISLTALPLGTVACSKGASSPTEPAFLDEPTVSASTSGLSSATDESKGRGRGGDDRADNNNGNNGKNKGKGKGKGKGRRGRGADDQPGDDKGGRRGGRGGGQDDNNNNNNNNPRVGQEFEGAVASVGGNSLTLTNGTRVIVNGQTQWIARGDLHSLNATASAVDANRPVRAEGRGTRQADGTFVAATIKVEVDD